MTIKTYYYQRLADGQINIKTDVVIKGKQIMPNKTDEKMPITFDYRTPKRADYVVTWLDKYDSDYSGNNVKITFNANSIMGLTTLFLKLTWWQRIKLKIIWDKYWLLRGDNFDRFVFKPLIAIAGGLVGYLIKTYAG